MIVQVSWCRKWACSLPLLPTDCGRILFFFLLRWLRFCFLTHVTQCGKWDRQKWGVSTCRVSFVIIIEHKDFQSCISEGSLALYPEPTPLVYLLPNFFREVFTGRREEGRNFLGGGNTWHTEFNQTVQTNQPLATLMLSGAAFATNMGDSCL